MTATIMHEVISPLSSATDGQVVLTDIGLATTIAPASFTTSVVPSIVTTMSASSMASAPSMMNAEQTNIFRNIDTCLRKFVLAKEASNDIMKEEFKLRKCELEIKEKELKLKRKQRMSEKIMNTSVGSKEIKKMQSVVIIVIEVVPG